MNAHDFVFWLRGYFAGLGTAPPTPEDWRVIKEALGEVSAPAPANFPPSYPTYPPGVRSWPVTSDVSL